MKKLLLSLSVVWNTILLLGLAVSMGAYMFILPRSAVHTLSELRQTNEHIVMPKSLHPVAMAGRFSLFAGEFDHGERSFLIVDSRDSCCFYKGFNGIIVIRTQKCQISLKESKSKTELLFSPKLQEIRGYSIK